ncbi:dienelactone hydrolase family protein [Polaromonas eurypsychrophila]|uniref:Dienelactone hydrolase domain-containing protein n=1 Tax=Polaromonas eurypsychrophila TaxID=1614635 RepID=A0A916SI73_9BURK|nr:dienelactone hydrolase family protein [Polaromonas eurypsychrophila]GGB01449.1 hypothetical protein GCM10011496_22980 [Polaromonas eurypsychrophila]
MKKLIWITSALFAGSLHGQELTQYLSAIAPALPKLELRLEGKELGIFSNLSNGFFKPRGTGPFPVVVLGHTCGGVKEPHLKERARELLDAGFAVMILDSFGPRGLPQCRGQTVITSNGTVRDAYQALDALATVADVDKSRIYFSGYSWGGVVAPMLASPQSSQLFGSGLRFRALVSNYGGCSYLIKTGGRRITYLAPDVDRPLLMLLAGNDKEFNPGDCFPLMQEMKAVGKPVEWHVYEGVHHAWDQSNHRGNYSVVTGSGETNVYLYNEPATRDSSRRMVDFFNLHR